MSKATKKPIVAESVPTPSTRRTTMVYVGEIDDTRRSAVMRPPSRPAHALPTLADYRLKPRGELPGESWRECCEQERAYTLGWREEGAPWSACRCPPFKDARAEHWLMGYDDARRNRVRASLDRRFILALGPSRWAAYDGRTRAEFASRDEAMDHMSGGGK